MKAVSFIIQIKFGCKREREYFTNNRILTEIQAIIINHAFI